MELDLAPGATVRDLLERLASGRPDLRPWLERFPALVDGQARPLTESLKDGDEVAWIPPVAGGAGAVVAISLTREPIDAERVRASVAAPEAGAIALFVGTVRDHEGKRRVESLEYEAYERVAEARLRTIAEEALATWPEARVAITHRLGKLGLGEASVAVAVATPHRAEAFDCCRHLMERLKISVPIWKRSIGPGGATWVEGKPYEA